MAEVVRPFKGVSAAERVARRRADILDAGFTVVGEVGVGQLTMTAVCEQAGLTQRYFYEQFRSVSELATVMFDTSFEEMFQQARDQVSRVSDEVVNIARAALTVLLDYYSGDPRKGRFFAESVVDPAVAARRAELIGAVAEYIVDQAARIGGRFSPAQRKRVMLATTVIINGQIDTTALLLAHKIELSREEYIDQVAELFAMAVEAARRPRKPSRAANSSPRKR